MLTPNQELQVKTLAWETGRLKSHQRPSQRILYEARGIAYKSPLKYVFCCGRGWGKSFYLFSGCVEAAIQYPGCDSVFVAPVQRKVAEYLEPIARDVFKDCPEDLKPRFYASDLIYKFPNR